MNNDGKKKANVRVVYAFAFLVLAAVSLVVFCVGKITRVGGDVYVFDGWVYGREDQKKASAALAAYFPFPPIGRARICPRLPARARIRRLPAKRAATRCAK